MTLPPTTNGRLQWLMGIIALVVFSLIGVIYTNFSNAISRLDTRLETVNATLAARGERLAIIEGQLKVNNERINLLQAEVLEAVKRKIAK